MKTNNILFGAILSLTFFISCDSNESAQDTSAVTTEEIIADSNIDSAVDDVSAIAEDQFSVQEGITNKSVGNVKSILPPCAVVTIVITNDSYTRTINFGAQGCALPNGNIVKGKIIVSFSKNFTTPIRTISYSFVDFYHNNKLIKGTKSITHTKKSTELLSTIHPVITHSIEMSITFADGRVFTRTGIRVREMVEGFNTPDVWEDNLFLVTGEHMTTFRNGSKIISKIIKPLRFVMSCKIPFPVSGTIVIVKNDNETKLDFGNGECDDLATVNVKGIIKEIHLKK
jgi:hypothetical protein